MSNPRDVSADDPPPDLGSGWSPSPAERIVEWWKARDRREPSRSAWNPSELAVAAILLAVSLSIVDAIVTTVVYLSGSTGIRGTIGVATDIEIGTQWLSSPMTLIALLIAVLILWYVNAEVPAATDDDRDLRIVRKARRARRRLSMWALVLCVAAIIESVAFIVTDFYLPGFDAGSFGVASLAAVSSTQLGDVVVALVAAAAALRVRRHAQSVSSGAEELPVLP